MSPRAAWRLESLGFSRVFDYAPGKLDWVSVGLPVEGTMAKVPNLGTLARRDSPTCKLDERLSDVKARLIGDPTSPCVVTNEHRIVLGLLRTEAIQANGSRTIEEAMLSGPVTYRPNAGLEEVDRYLTDHHLGYALVTTSDGELMGLASAGDIQRQLGESKAG